MQGSWKSALVPFFARIPRRVGYLREMRYGLHQRHRGASRKSEAKDCGSLLRTGPRRHRSGCPASRSTKRTRHGSSRAFALQAGRFAALMPGAEYGPAKRWPASNYAGLARELMSKGLQVALFGSTMTAPSPRRSPRSRKARSILPARRGWRTQSTCSPQPARRVERQRADAHRRGGRSTPVVAIYGSTSPAQHAAAGRAAANWSGWASPARHAIRKSARSAISTA